jgi:hypothetical protein
MYYKTKHFDLKEFFDDSTYKKLAGSNVLSGLIDDRILITMDNIREYFDTQVYINNWMHGKSFRFRGFRPSWCDVGSQHSQHRYGRAVDFDVVGIPAEEVRKEILVNQKKEEFKYITAMEYGTNWVHIDCRNIDCSGIKLFNP